MMSASEVRILIKDAIEKQRDKVIAAARRNDSFEIGRHIGWLDALVTVYTEITKDEETE